MTREPAVTRTAQTSAVTNNYYYQRQRSGIALFFGIMLLVVIALLAAVFIYLYKLKRIRKLIDKWDEMAKKKNISLPKQYLFESMQRLTFEELNNLEIFTQALHDRDYGTAFIYLPDIKKLLLTNTDLGILRGIAGIDFNTLK